MNELTKYETKINKTLWEILAKISNLERKIDRIENDIEKNKELI